MKTFNRRGFIYSSSQVYEYSMELSVLELISYSGMKLYQLVFNGMNLVCAAGLTTKSFCQKNKNKKKSFVMYSCRQISTIHELLF